MKHPPRIDIHAHVLPGVDDGAANMDVALEMLAQAAADGTRTIIATPHDRFVRGDEIADRVAELNRAARQNGIEIVVLPGSEAMIAADLPLRFAAGRVATLNDTAYLLLELPLQASFPPFLLRAVYDLQVAGALPILAHAERYPAVQRHPDVLRELIQRGVMVQVNADSLTGNAGRRAARTASMLVRRRMAHIIASDAHGVSSRRAVIAEAHARVMKFSAPDIGATIDELPQRILCGESVTLPDPIPERSRERFASSLLRRMRR